MRLVSPTEVDRQGSPGLFTFLQPDSMTSSIPEKYGADVLSFIKGQGPLAIQRKEYPGDFISSIMDGRMAREIILNQKARFIIWALEGAEPFFTSEGYLMDSYHTRWTKDQLHNAEHSLWWNHGIRTIRTSGMRDTADRIRELEKYLSGGSHHGFINRPKHIEKDSWGEIDPEAEVSFFLQGLPNVGDKTARAIYNHFGKRLPMKWICKLNDIKGIPGIGKITATKIYYFGGLNGKRKD